MENKHKNFLSRKYANAFLNTHLNAVSEENLNQLSMLSNFFSLRKEGLYFIHLANVDDKIKLEAIMNLIEKFNFASLKPLCSLLIEDRRIFLLPQVLEYIKQSYLKRMNVMEFDVSSTVILTDEQRDTIKFFLEKKTGKKIKAQYTIDLSLIAGLRIQSDQYKWEGSVSQELTRLKAVNILD